MNIEMQSAEINTHQSYAFIFSRPVKEYLIGFSKFTLEYLRPDHHVKRISIDLSNSRLNGTEVVVKPHLILYDDNEKHYESALSSIVVNVIAIVGDKNPHIHMIPEVDERSIFDLPENTIIIKSTLITADVQYPDKDHHLWKFWSKIEPVVDGQKCSLVGEAKIKDNGSNFGDGTVKGSVIAYTGNPQNFICTDFDSQKLGDSGKILVGYSTESFQDKDYDVACFVDGFEVSYENPDKDHHVLKIEIGACLAKKRLVEEDGKVYAKVVLKSFLVDNGEHMFDIPHNSVSGFVIAFKNNE